MKHEIDLYKTKYPPDHRWDRDRNAKLLNIVFEGGTFGNFLKFFLDKFTKLSPDIGGDPFTTSGASHAISSHKFSGLIQRYHASFINDNRNERELPICIILPTTKKHFLYLKMSQWYRVSDQKITPDDLWAKPIGDMPDMLYNGTAKHLIDLYDIRNLTPSSYIPKFIVRDFYKLEFLNALEDTFDHQWFDTFKSHDFFRKQNIFHLDLETFFDFDRFIHNMKELDKKFDLDLDFDRQNEMEEIFDKGLSLDPFRIECNQAIGVLEGTSGDRFSSFNVVTEAFIYAEIEKQNPDIQMPLTNGFFETSEEIRQFIKYFPNWYRRKNPNLPQK